MENVVLIGMPGCGKSTVGVILAKTLGVDFIDTDLVIQKREGGLLQELLNSRGMEAFLDAESAAVRPWTAPGRSLPPAAAWSTGRRQWPT